MRNSERYKTADARVKNYFTQSSTIGAMPTIQGFADWLEIEAMPDKPRECPICGLTLVSVDKIENHESIGFSLPIYRVVCACGSSGPSAGSELEAVELWNNRSYDEDFIELRKRIHEIESEENGGAK